MNKKIHLTVITYIGIKTLSLLQQVARVFLFLYTFLITTCTTRPQYKLLLQQMERVGVESLFIVVLTGASTGMVFAIQIYSGFSQLGGEPFAGTVVALGMIKELGPVLTGLMVTGRAGSAMAAEMGTMQVTEQIDALRTLHINPFSYLIVPRIISTTVIMPFLVLFCMICGILGGYVVCALVVEANTQDFVNNIVAFITLYDILTGLIKATVFGFILSTVGCYKGLYAQGGARGVGRATTQAVVSSSTLILTTNYLLTQLLERV